MKKNGSGKITVSNVTVSSVVIKVITSYDYSANISVSLGDTALTLPSVADVAATKVDTGSLSGSYAINCYTITVTLDEAVTGDLVINNTTGYAVYLESITINH